MKFLLCLFLLAAAPSCISVSSDSRLFVYSEPDGAKVLLNGEDTGYTTPAVLDYASGVVSISKRGYATEDRPVGKFTYLRIPRVNDAGTTDFSLAIPILFWVQHDTFYPFQIETLRSPRRIFVRLLPVAAPPASGPATKT